MAVAIDDRLRNTISVGGQEYHYLTKTERIVVYEGPSNAGLVPTFSVPLPADITGLFIRFELGALPSRDAVIDWTGKTDMDPLTSNATNVQQVFLYRVKLVKLSDLIQSGSFSGKDFLTGLRKSGKSSYLNPGDTWQGGDVVAIPDSTMGTVTTSNNQLSISPKSVDPWANNPIYPIIKTIYRGAVSLWL